MSTSTIPPKEFPGKSEIVNEPKTSSGLRVKSLILPLSWEWSDHTHVLHLERDNWPRKQALNTFADNETKLVYQAWLHQKYRWRKVDTVVKSSHLSNDTVLRILYDLENKDFVRKAPFLSIDSKEMWGATAVVGISPKINLS